MSEQAEPTSEILRRAQARPPFDKLRASGARVDPLLLGAVLLLVAIGMIFVYSASAVRQQAAVGDQFHHLKRQLLATGLGLGLLVAAVGIGTDRIARLAYPIMAATLVLLLLVLSPIGKAAGGAQRWIPIGPLQLQPAELAKVALVLYLAHSLARKRDKVRLFSIGLVPHVVVTGLVAALCLKQRDLGTGVLLFLVLLAMLFTAGARVVYLLGALAASVPVLYHYVHVEDYRWKRWMAFLDPIAAKDQKYGQQLYESLAVISRGGWLGQGLGQGRTRFYHLPAADNDFIASAIGEQVGWLGLAVVIALFAVVVWRGLAATRRATDAFGCYAAVGMSTLIGGQALVHLGVAMALLPTKGLTLPFVSYGGSSMLAMLAGVGVLLAVTTERGGFLSPTPGAVRVGAAPRLRASEAEEAP